MLKENIILITGCEDYLIRKKVIDLRSYASTELDLIEMDTPGLLDLLSACVQVPFGNHKVVVASGNFFDKSYQGLDEYISSPCGFTTLCLVCPVADKRKNLYKLIDKHGKVYSFDKLKEFEYIHFISDYLSSRGVQYTPGIPEYIAERTGYLFADEASIGEVVADINRLISYCNQSKISKAIIDRLITPFVDTDVFRFIDLIASQKYGPAQQHLSNLLAAGTNELHILSLIQRHYRILYKIKLTRTPDNLGLSPFILKSFSRASQISLEELERSVELATNTIKSIKASTSLNPSIELQILIAELSRVKDGGIYCDMMNN